MIPSNYIVMREAEEHEMEEKPCLQTLPLSGRDPVAYVMVQWWHEDGNFQMGEWRALETYAAMYGTPPRADL